MIKGISDIHIMKELCVSHGFTRRGKAFFRVVGDGVLQVLHYRICRQRQNPDIMVGLFSLYGDLMNQWLTSSGCIPRYVLYALVEKDPPDVLARLIGKPFDWQLDILKTRGIPWLDAIDTQEKLLEGIFALESATGSIIWNDSLKLPAALASGQLDVSQRIIHAILNQHASATSSWKKYMDPDEYSSSVRALENEERPLYEILHMTEAGDIDAIRLGLNKCYMDNLPKVKFCMTKGGSNRAGNKTE